jgi:uncharacterized RDD family membrane protein YckC
MDKAGFVSRFFAFLLDGFFMVILAWAVRIILGSFINLTTSSGSGFLNFLGDAATILLAVILLLFQFLYFGYYWNKNGKSIGMRLLSVKVVRQTAGEDLSFIRAGLRGSLGYWISGLVFGLGYLWALIDANKETWHDKIFDTWVVKD